MTVGAFGGFHNITPPWSGQAIIDGANALCDAKERFHDANCLPGSKSLDRRGKRI